MQQHPARAAVQQGPSASGNGEAPRQRFGSQRGDGIPRKGPRENGERKGAAGFVFKIHVGGRPDLPREGKGREHHPQSRGEQRANKKQEQTARRCREPQILLETFSETTEAGPNARFPFPQKMGNALLLQSRTKAKRSQIFCWFFFLKKRQVDIPFQRSLINSFGFHFFFCGIIKNVISSRLLGALE